MTQESCGLKPGWLGVSKLLFPGNGKILKMISSNIFPQMGKGEAV